MASSPIENPDLIPPDQVVGLRDYFLILIGEPPTSAPILAAGRVYPNPVASGDRVRFSLPGAEGAGSADVEIHDLTGRTVRTLNSLRAVGGGVFETRWDGRDDAGRSLPRGAYFCTIRSGSVATTASLQIVR